MSVERIAKKTERHQKDRLATRKWATLQCVYA